MTETTSQQNAPADLASIGMAFNSWQEAVEAAIASNRLSVTGELRGGQLISFDDPSGARITILAVEPFATFAGFDSAATNQAHVSMVNDVLGVVDILDVNDNVIASVAAHIAQGPLLVDEPTQQWQPVGITGLAVDAEYFPTPEAAWAAAARRGVGSEDTTLPFIHSRGIEIINQGAATTPDASAIVIAKIAHAEYRINTVTNTKFQHLTLEGPWALDITVADNQPLPQAGEYVVAHVVLSAAIAAPAGCGGGNGGCGCGAGGCGSH